MNTKRYLAVAGLIVALLLAGLGSLGTHALDRNVSKKVIQSVVLLTAADTGRSGRPVVKWFGSGTIVSADGLILTNCHVVNPKAMLDDPRFTYEKLIVSLTTRSDQPPQPTYLAEVVQFDPHLDLAVIRIKRTVDGQAVDSARLNLPALPLGDSDDIEVGDSLAIFGFPGIGGETITLTSGDVSGFTQERGIKGRAWIKTDASISAGNSGGAGVNEKGELVGVPTQAGSGGEDIVDCRRVADTNGDGAIDERDNCVSMGGFINALRPANLARPLIEAASSRLNTQPTPTGKPTPTPPAGGPRASRLIFAPEVTEDDQPVTVVQSFPSGTRVIYLFFDYENWRDGATFDPELKLDGKLAEGAWAASRWSGGPRGMYWLGITGKPLDDGEYEFIINYDDRQLGSAKVSVGGREQALPSFSNIAFFGDGKEGYLLPAGIKQVDADFQYANMTPRDRWSRVWYYGGKELLRRDGETFARSAGKSTVSLNNENGFDAGNFRLELYIGDRLAATADFEVGGDKSQRTGPSFGPITFAEGVDRQGKPQWPGTTFASGLTDLYAIFDFQGMQDGWKWTPRWILNGRVAVENERAWDDGARGTTWTSAYNREGLPDGEYRLELLVEGEVLQSGTCTVGRRVQPTPTPRAARGGFVYLHGYIVDADTGRGIAGASIVVLKPGITWSQYQRRYDQCHTWADTDLTGYFQLPLPVERGETYSIGASAYGYYTVTEDGVTVDEDIPSPFLLEIKLQRLR